MPVLIGAGEWKVLLCLRPLLPEQGFGTVPEGRVEEQSGFDVKAVTRFISLLVNKGALVQAEGGNDRELARGEDQVEVRKRSDSPHIIYAGSVDAYLANGHDAPDTGRGMPGGRSNLEPAAPEAEGQEPPEAAVSHPADVSDGDVDLTKVRPLDQNLGPEEVRLGRYLWQELGAFYRHLNLPALEREVPISRPATSLIRLVAVGAFRVRPDGQIGRGKPKVRQSQPGRMPDFITVDLSKEETDPDQVLNGVPSKPNSNVPMTMDLSGLTPDVVTQYLTLRLQLAEQERRLREAEAEHDQLTAQQRRAEQEQARIKRLVEGLGTRVAASEKKVRDCQAAVATCQRALRADHLQVAQTVATLTESSHLPPGRPAAK